MRLQGKKDFVDRSQSVQRQHAQRRRAIQNEEVELLGIDADTELTIATDGRSLVVKLRDFGLAALPGMAGRRIVTVCCSSGERYLSTPLFADLIASQCKGGESS